jgi:sulfonate transport system substrate-binding protein
LVALEGQEMPAALEKRTVDAVSIWEPHAQHSLETLGADAVILEDPAAYTERFNLNTRTDVLSNPAKRRAMAALMQEIARASNRLRTRPAELISLLAPKVALPAQTVTAVWPQFKFPASISNGLRTVMSEVEPWAAAIQKRAPQSQRERDALIDNTLAAEALR